MNTQVAKVHIPEAAKILVRHNGCDLAAISINGQEYVCFQGVRYHHSFPTQFVVEMCRKSWKEVTIGRYIRKWLTLATHEWLKIVEA